MQCYFDDDISIHELSELSVRRVLSAGTADFGLPRHHRPDFARHMERWSSAVSVWYGLIECPFCSAIRERLEVEHTVGDEIGQVMHLYSPIQPDWHPYQPG